MNLKKTLQPPRAYILTCVEISSEELSEVKDHVDPVWKSKCMELRIKYSNWDPPTTSKYGKKQIETANCFQMSTIRIGDGRSFLFTRNLIRSTVYSCTMAVCSSILKSNLFRNRMCFTFVCTSDRIGASTGFYLV